MAIVGEVLQLVAEIPSAQGLYNQENTRSTGCAWVSVSCLIALSGDNTTPGSALSVRSAEADEKCTSKRRDPACICMLSQSANRAEPHDAID